MDASEIAGRVRVLFICTANSARSQIAEAILRKYAGDMVSVHSAGTDPAADIHPMARRVLLENGIDPEHQFPEGVETYADQEFDIIITTCDAARENCPFFPGNAIRYHWGLDDPAATQGSEKERVAAFETTFTAVSERVRALVGTIERIRDNPARRRA